MIVDNRKFQDLFEGQRIYRANNDRFSFDVLDDIWQLGTKDYLVLNWMHNVDYDEKTFIYVRVLLAKLASMTAVGSAKRYLATFKKIGNNLEEIAFQRIWPTLGDSYKFNLATIFSFANKKNMDAYGLYEFTSRNRPSFNVSKNILDPSKGTYSEYEYQVIKEQFRLQTDENIKLAHQAHYTPSKLNAFSNLIANQLMHALVRRPVQLCQLKWCDVLPVGQSFTDHRYNKSESVPKYEYLFSDIDVLHIRTFRGKDGMFRSSVERTSHRIEPNLSALILLYREKYEQLLTKSLREQEVILTAEELYQFIMQCPIFPGLILFSTVFGSKKCLFGSVGYMSDRFHKTSISLIRGMRDCLKKLDLKSDRIDNDKILFTNNRLRHHVLTEAARQGLSGPYLAKITGVTEKAVKPYLDLSVEARLDIDQAFANKDVLNKYSRIGVNDLQYQEGFAIRNEFDEEIGIQRNKVNCESCAAKLGAPLGCYPCENFIANEDANHQLYLDKAMAKYKLNQNQSDKVVLGKLRKIILYIQATINLCAEYKINKQGLRNET
ncbi:MAG: hypothetical protein ACJAZP_002381 [Psychromonas sp.]|jgi:hypothetical protein|uniref:hypothetical protein n=1 Tax=Psychromonas sp. TaxID=1884585 RepID=UPI0039E2F896